MSIPIVCAILKKKRGINHTDFMTKKIKEKEPMVPFHMTYEDSLMRQIDDFRFEFRYLTRAAAIKDLVRAGLKAAGRIKKK